MYTYIFKIYFNILEEAGISVPKLEVEPVAFSTVVLKINKNLTEAHIETIKTKLKNFYNNKFNLSTAEVKLEQVIK